MTDHRFPSRVVVGANAVDALDTRVDRRSALRSRGLTSPARPRRRPAAARQQRTSDDARRSDHALRVDLVALTVGRKEHHASRHRPSGPRRGRVRRRDQGDRRSRRVRARLGAGSVRSVHHPVRRADDRAAVLPVVESDLVARGGVRGVRGDARHATGRLGDLRSLRRSPRASARTARRILRRRRGDRAARRAADDPASRAPRTGALPRAASRAGRLRRRCRRGDAHAWRRSRRSGARWCRR
jgi:hypothetical protein